MPPSLLSVDLVGRAICPEWPAAHTPPLTLALSPERGDRFVDAAFRSRLNMEKGTYLWIQARFPQTPQRGFEHNNQPYFQTPEVLQTLNPEPGEMTLSAPFSPYGRRAGDEGEANLQATLRAIASCSAGASPKRSTR